MKPEYRKPIIHNIPQELKAIPHWVVWRAILKHGKWTKPPFDAKIGRAASHSNPATWADFGSAWSAYNTGSYDGIGFVLTKDLSLVGFDFDHCIGGGEIAPEVNQILGQLQTYAEYSPTDGIRVLAFGRKPGDRCKLPSKGYEVYDNARYLTITGHRVNGCNQIEKRQAEIEAVCRAFFGEEKSPEQQPSSSSIDMEDHELLEKAFRSSNGNRIRALYEGDVSGYSSKSEADQAFCNHLAFWTGCDAARMDRIFRSSCLMREKWDRRAKGQITYGEVTIDSAISGCSNAYDPNFHGGGGGDDHTETDTGVALWEDPIPIKSGIPPVLPFDFMLLPEEIRGWVKDTAHRIQCPPDFPAIVSMVSIGAIIGRKIGIRPKQKDDWLVVPTLWGQLIGRPSVSKSPPLKACLKPLRRIEFARFEQYQEEMKAFTVDNKVHDLKVADAEKRARAAIKDGKDSEAHRIISSVEDDQPKRPTRGRIVVNDTTVEKLGELLNENPNGLLLFRDELSGFLRTINRDDRSNDRSFYLESWDGTGSYSYDRIGRGTIDIQSNTVSILGCIQPGKLLPLVRSAVKSDKDDDGFMQRFQLAVYPDKNSFTYVDAYPDKNAQDNAYNFFDQIAAMDQPATEDDIPYLKFDPAAQELFIDWLTELETEIRGDDIHPALESHFAKYRSLIPSLALIIHLANDKRIDLNRGVTEQAMVQALGWYEYLRSHAERIYAMATGVRNDDAKRLFKKIRNGNLKKPFTVRMIRLKGWGGFTDNQAIEETLAILEDHKWIKAREIVPSNKGGRPTTEYHINPKLFAEGVE